MSEYGTIVVDDIEREMTNEELEAIKKTRLSYEKIIENEKNKKSETEFKRKLVLEKLNALGLNDDDLLTLGL